MNLKQKILKFFYPWLMLLHKMTGRQKKLVNENKTLPPVSFYELSVELNNGKTLSMQSLRGKKILLVNTASNCGYTAQYAELQKLYRHLREDLEIIAFPSNDFKEQEKKNDEEIAQFCAVNYGLGFPITKKTSVSKGVQQHPVYRWLSHKELNGWNDQPPSWNFSKYLISEDGILSHYFDAGISPVDESFLSATHH